MTAAGVKVAATAESLWTGLGESAKALAVPTFAIHCIDKPLSAELRAATRPEHLRYLKAAVEKVVVAGPLLDDAGAPIGSMLLMNFPDRKAAVAFAAKDPYAEVGLFASVAVTAWRQVLPEN
ncbi:YciI family protein [Sandaracinobacteroides saxicola]|uniref:YciI family protein n=1 Tax=Sandaracinobacteroides saxicola TaxID=2759707 RepID=A0A7G5IF37_9SPHN|nr:YciI family protein [Sandaracinobacteroides saxicola]QMW21979.1 YciI family protein [Sandaracinobacteroides saxicola]